MLRAISRQLNLITKLSFGYNQGPRDPTIPTESDVMLPYSINFLHDNKGAVRYPKQVGRGPGSGKGYVIFDLVKHQAEATKGNFHDLVEVLIQDSKEVRLPLR